LRKTACTFLNFTFSFTLLTLAVFAVFSELWSLNNFSSAKSIVYFISYSTCIFSWDYLKN